MRVAVSAQGVTLDAAVDPRFGRCATFLVVETDDGTWEVIDNRSAALSGGAGIQSARVLASHGVKTLLTGNCGPNAHETLKAAGIAVFVGCAGTVAAAIERFRQGQPQPASVPNVGSHAGMEERRP